MTDRPRRPETSAAAFKALAHPLRVRMYHELGKRAATATALAEALGESTGSTSYHLRQLARHGLIEEDPTRGTGRERWWKPAGTGLNVSPETLFQDVEAARTLTETTLDEWHLAARRAIGRLLSGELPKELTEVTTLSEYTLTGTPGQLTDLFDKLEALLQPFLSSRVTTPSEDAVRVTAQIIAYPEV